MNFPAVTAHDLDALATLVSEHSPVVVLTGAGCSTESGIPDYRGPEGTWHRRRPMQYGEFMRSEASRRHYWARNYLGWPRFDAAEPNATHRALARMEQLGVCTMLITQNVDSLHRRAGTTRIIELHGQSDRVACTDCGDRTPRLALQLRMQAMNRHWDHTTIHLNPDADAELTRNETEAFVVPACENCGGVLKPDVVFFGENVPPDRVSAAMAAVENAGSFLVAGSSLAVWSGYRFARRACDAGVPIAIVNYGETRADDLATLRVSARCSDALARLADRLERTHADTTAFSLSGS